MIGHNMFPHELIPHPPRKHVDQLLVLRSVTFTVVDRKRSEDVGGKRRNLRLSFALGCAFMTEAGLDAHWKLG